MWRTNNVAAKLKSTGLPDLHSEEVATEAERPPFLPGNPILPEDMGRRCCRFFIHMWRNSVPLVHYPDIKDLMPSQLYEMNQVLLLS